MTISDLFPAIDDIIHVYRRYRRRGENRADACVHILEDFQDELTDVDEAPQIWIGLAKALGARRELTPEICEKAEQGFHALAAAFPEEQMTILKSLPLICNPERIGAEAIYRPHRIYVPDWQIGDTFMYNAPGMQERIYHRTPKLKEGKWSLIDKVILVRKAQEVFTIDDTWDQYVYLTVCPQDHLPTSSRELNELGYLPSMIVSSQRNLYEFKFSINAKSKRYLESYHLIKIGCFPDIQPPKGEVEPSLQCGANPLFPSSGPEDLSSIEMYACRYINYGLLH